MQKLPKYNFYWGFALDPTGEVYSAARPPRWWEAGWPQEPHPFGPQAAALRALHPSRTPPTFKHIDAYELFYSCGPATAKDIIH